VGFEIGAVGVAPAAQERGSHGWRLDVAGVGAAIPLGVDDEGVVAGTARAPDPVEGTGAGAAGGFTANWVPVTTVT